MIRKMLNKLHSKLIIWLIGNKPVILNVAVGLPDRNTAASIEPILSPYIKKGRGQQSMLIKNVLVYKPLTPTSGPGYKSGKILRYEIDQYESTKSIGVDPEWL